MIANDAVKFCALLYRSNSAIRSTCPSGGRRSHKKCGLATAGSVTRPRRAMLRLKRA
jgi:hypothetical protein